MDPTTYDDLLKAAIDSFLKLWNALPPSIRAKVLAEWTALMNALRLARSAGTSAADLKPVLKALKRFLAALAKAGGKVPHHVRTFITLIEGQMSAEAGAAGALTTVGAILLALFALILVAKSIYEVYKMNEPTDPPMEDQLAVVPIQ